MTRDDDHIDKCLLCRLHLVGESFRGTLFAREGLVLFRLCATCRGAVDDRALDRIRQQCEQGLALAGPARGHA